MKFLIVDDHVVVRSGLRQMLAEEFSDATFGEAGTAAEALERVFNEKWDLALLDITLPGRSGLDVLGELRSASPGLPVIILSMHPEAEFAVRALKAGAVGYLTKQSAAEELIDAVKKALDGGRYITASLAEKLAENLAAGSAGDLPHTTLSNREFQTFRLLAGGKGVKDIAGELSLSAKTVSTYRTRVLDKLGLKTTVDLARYALQHHLIE